MPTVKKFSKYVPLFMIIVASLLMIWPFWCTGEVYGDDRYFHLARCEYWYQLMHHLEPYSYGDFYTFRRAGYPLDAFYPMFTFFPAAIIRLVVVSPITAYYVFLLLLNVVTGFICYYIGLKMWKSRWGSLAFALIYMLSYYRIMCVFQRAAVGEILAMAFMPLCVYGFYKIIDKKQPSFIILGVAMTLIAYSHVISIMLAVLLLLLLFLFYLKDFVTSWKTCRRLLYSVLLFCVLTLIYLGPALEQMGGRMLHPAYQPNLEDTKISLGKMIAASFTNDAGWEYLYILGVVMLLVLIVGACCFLKLSRFGKALLCSSVILLLFMTCMDFSLLQDTFFAQIQFVWRMIGIISVSLAFVAGELLSKISVHGYGKGLISLISVSVIILSFWQVKTILATAQIDYPEQGKQSISDENYDALLESMYIYDYLTDNMNAQRDSINEKEIFFTDGSIKAGYMGNHFVMDVDATRSSTINTFIPFYKGITVSVNQHNTNVLLSDRDTVAVQVPSGKSRVVIGYRTTLCQQISWCISIAAWLVLVGILIWRRKRQACNGSE
ncbi:6-pyruvoyl-tetrahydropterin synthase-related protein [Listeria costaricensis]|uniref:6-pyruvoyl-tetrahydropterin synthase-related protein n=1 Tax=Listeria costaricensis TaxID=2026604 RepID=UPI000C08A993|nr:6-pyruvoyl-tetrahydropterin synthase-related protein [Listeria costaricensis]